MKCEALIIDTDKYCNKPSVHIIDNWHQREDGTEFRILTDKKEIKHFFGSKIYKNEVEEFLKKRRNGRR